MSDPNDLAYPVGYKKPPSHTQFKLGQSGNVKGRPKGAKNFATVFAEELRAPIEVTENGKRKRISKRQAIVKQTTNKAVSGDSKATALVLNEVRFYESQGPSSTHDIATSPEDQAVMASILRRLRQSSPTARNTAEESIEPPAPDTEPSNQGEP